VNAYNQKTPSATLTQILNPAQARTGNR